MATYQCPQGHSSTDADYCSECGARIGQSTVASMTSATAAPSRGADVCPDCMTPRTAGARFCEVCRYDFEAGQSNAQAFPTPAKPMTVTSSPDTVSIPAVSVPVTPVVNVTPAVATPAVERIVPAAASSTRLNVVIITDPSLAEDDEMRQQCPQGMPELVFPLDLEENLVGRRSDTKKIYPEIDISDPGVSHRQLKFIKQADGSLVALELGSANGTTLNGVELKPGLMTAIKAGDELLVGMWTRLQIRNR